MTTLEPTKPKPGIYTNVPFADYLGWEAISNSRLNLAVRSLAHYRNCVFKEPTPALRLGSFVHCGVLEPLQIALRYAVLPPFERDSRNVTKDGKPSSSKNTKFYESEVEKFIAANPGKELVTQDEYDRLLGITRSLASSDRAREWLTERGEAEVSIVWEDEETGLLCKARIDYLTTAIVDLKTTMDAAKFNKSFAAYGYHRQMAHYREGYMRLTGEYLQTRIIAVETSSPFAARAAPVNEDALEVGMGEVRKALRDVAEAYRTDKWPCYVDPSSWVLPAYYEGGDSEIELVVDGQKVSI